MAPHAKYLAIYEAPFWRALGLSGQARSAAGPLGEIHDASLPDGPAALFGFFGVPAGVRQRVPDAEMRALCRAQLVRLFGATAATAQHAGAPPATAADGPWRGRLTGIASEWSPQFPGYLAGAIDAASRGIQQWEN
jgi:monoamine oxidase